MSPDVCDSPSTLKGNYPVCSHGVVAKYIGTAHSWKGKHAFHAHFFLSCSISENKLDEKNEWPCVLERKYEQCGST